MCVFNRLKGNSRNRPEGKGDGWLGGYCGEVRQSLAIFDALASRCLPIALTPVRVGFHFRVARAPPPLLLS